MMAAITSSLSPPPTGILCVFCRYWSTEKAEPLDMNGVTSHRSDSTTKEAHRGITWSFRHIRIVLTSM